jgi:phosphoribosylformylglycinamidine synthase
MNDPKPSLQLIGGQAFPPFRHDAILNNLKASGISPTPATFEAHTVYFIHGDGDRIPKLHDKIYALLGTDQHFSGGDGFYVTPRKGTISPWSSKASDIFANCGLSAVSRVEHGIYLRVLDANGTLISGEALGSALCALYDRMTEGVYAHVDDLFFHKEPPTYTSIDIVSGGRDAMERANVDMGLALSPDEVDYLMDAYSAMQRNPTDVELLMFAQVNSEHCRHKIFNASWVLDGKQQSDTLFDMIRNTHRLNPEGTLVAYKDNSGVLEGFLGDWFEVDVAGSKAYHRHTGLIDMIMKVETHNHPTAISPYPGAATGVGGEIRDEGATGIGSKSKAGLSAFFVSNLRVPGFVQPWEKEQAGFPTRLATPYQIMMEAPIGGADFGNEFGRPQLLGIFRTYEDAYAGKWRGYHKPIMVAGGMGNIKREHVEKHEVTVGALVIQLGGPALRIGIGGGAASSMATGSNAEDLDFNSVQRGNAEMERRCQEVINGCIALGDENPIQIIHDVGAGGLSNACPELIESTGGSFELRKVPNQEPSMSPMEIWCCEAQERYMLCVAPENIETFMALCERERCPAHVIGQATGDRQFSVRDEAFNNTPIDLGLDMLLGKPPRTIMEATTPILTRQALDLPALSVSDLLQRILRAPAVAKKTFLITIADRSVTGLVARDQMVGAHQEPLADCAVTTLSFESYHGEAMSMGERTPVALISPAASGRMAVGEALLNMAGTDIDHIGNAKLSGNWMCACGENDEDFALYETVHAIGMELCPALGVSIPVGKDSMSMRTVWQDENGTEQSQSAPLSLIITAFAPVSDVRRTLTPDLKPVEESTLLLLDLGGGKNRMGGSVLAQTFNQVGDTAPDLDDPAAFKAAFGVLQSLVREERLLAYHDRSDGGLVTTLVEMAIAGRRGLQVDVAALGDDACAALFSEELGAVIQVGQDQLDSVLARFAEAGLSACVHTLGTTTGDSSVRCSAGTEVLLDAAISDLNQTWSELTYHMQSQRDDPGCAKEEFERTSDRTAPGLTYELTYDPEQAPAEYTTRPRLAVLREQGINGHVEMAAAFDRAGFESFDVHMTDLLEGRVSLSSFNGLVACGGFSYGDVLGAGSGWARSILFNEGLRADFETFFAHQNTFALGVCNGCQMLSQLKSIIPGAQHWPRFLRNRSEQFEARLSNIEVLPSPSIFFKGMQGSKLTIPVAHGEGRIAFETDADAEAIRVAGLLSLRYIEGSGEVAQRYPANPNGSPDGVTGMTTTDGRVTIMMPHPERAFRASQLSYVPKGLLSGDAGPWLRMFQNARAFSASKA